jgi:L-threonylcarbamoyladenylate synthase
MRFSTEIIQAAEALQQGRLVAFPTETVYGLGADATSDDAVARLYAAKGRPRFNPLISHVAEAEAAMCLGRFSTLAQKLAAAFWPGPLTLVVARREACPVSLLASAGLPTLALRVPAHPLALALLRQVQRPIVAPSANPSGRISPTTAEHVRRAMGDRIAMVVDGGPCAVGVESTVVSCVGEQPVLLRPGGLSRQAIEDVLGFPLVAEADAAQPHAPGQLASHYAPRAALRLNATAPGAGETYLGFGLNQHGPHTLSARGDVVEAAARLFAELAALDATGPQRIAVAPIPLEGLGEAINDRLRRAAAPRPDHDS